MAVILDKKTNHYFIDCKIKRQDGAYYHFVHHNNKNSNFKNKEYVKELQDKLLKKIKNNIFNTSFISFKEIKDEEMLYSVINERERIRDELDVTHLETLEDLIKRFLYSLELEVSLNTYMCYSYKCNYIIKFFNNSLEELFSLKRLEDFKNHLLLLKKTNPLYLTLLKNLIIYSRRIKLINSDTKDDCLLILTSLRKTKEVKKRVERNNFTPLNEALEFINSIKSQRMKYIYRFLYFSGLRVGEFLGIKIKDISFINNDIALINIERQRLTTVNLLSNKLKTSESYKTIALVNDTCHLLKDYIERYNLKEEDLLCSLSYYQLRYRFKKDQRESDVKINNTLHGFGRKSLNTLLYLEGADSKVRMTLLGHKTEIVNQKNYIDNKKAFDLGIKYLKRLDNNITSQCRNK